MLEKEIRIKILKNYHESKADWLNKEFKKEIGGTNMSKEEGIRINLEEFYPEEEILKALRDAKDMNITKKAKIIVDKQENISELINERDKYKSLYQNEKDRADTLQRIIKKIEENLKTHLNAKSYGNHKYELFRREYLEKILDLLKEMK